MPIYEVLCPRCGVRESLIREFVKVGHRVKCPLCGDPEAKRILSPVTVGNHRKMTEVMTDMGVKAVKGYEKYAEWLGEPVSSAEEAESIAKRKGMRVE